MKRKINAVTFLIVLYSLLVCSIMKKKEAQYVKQSIQHQHLLQNSGEGMVEASSLRFFSKKRAQ